MITTYIIPVEDSFEIAEDNELSLEVNFSYDPDLYGEEDPSQSPWNYITIESLIDSNGCDVELDDDQLYELKEILWDEFKMDL